jgi:hypothetical protein
MLNFSFPDLDKKIKIEYVSPAISHGSGKDPVAPRSFPVFFLLFGHIESFNENYEDEIK